MKNPFKKRVPTLYEKLAEQADYPVRDPNLIFYVLGTVAVLLLFAVLGYVYIFYMM